MLKIACTVLLIALMGVTESSIAQDAQPAHREKTWTEVLTRIPCGDFRRNGDGSWTLPGTLTVDETGRSYSDLTYTLQPPEDNGAKILEMRCGSGGEK